MSLNSLHLNPSLGPIYTPQKTREQYSPELSETASLTDRVFQDTSSGQKLRFPSYQFANPLPVDVSLDLSEVIEEYEEMIEEHVERRVLFFFHQLIVCYATQLHFESTGAQHQGKSADAIVQNIQGHMDKFTVRQAAHSSGSPCLIAYDAIKWAKFQAGKGIKPEGVVFLKNTDSYRMANATMNMPKCVNDADREIDEKTAASQLREKGLEIINRASKGKITPDQGLSDYIELCLSEVKSAKARLSASKKDPLVQKVLAYYKTKLEELEGIVEDDPSFLEQSLNVQMGHLAQNERAKRVILQMRYAAIRNCQVNQSALIQKIEAVRANLLAALKAQNGGRQPDNFKAAFNSLLIGATRTVQDKQRLEKLLNFSPSNFEKQIEGGALTKYNNTKEKLAASAQVVDSLAKDLIADMRTFRTEETYQRSKTIKTLRSMYKWTQKELGQNLKTAFQTAAASQSTISRIENRQKLVTEPIAIQFGRVFQIDSVLFMPHFYYN